jgi:lipooligosaccharide transport system ATP-binding protein
VNDAQPVHARLKQRGDLRYLHRPANLEDVFLRLTGREMQD